MYWKVVWKVHQQVSMFDTAQTACNNFRPFLHVGDGMLHTPVYHTALTYQ